jgi:dolichyl-phosphate-mannose--protein O-mannosyl transferase
LHSHYGIPSPSTCQQEVTTYVKHAYDYGIGDYNDNWVIDAILGPCGFGSILRNGCAIKLRHEASSHMLHSHECHWFLPGKQEVTAYSYCDDNDWFVVELEGQEACNEGYVHNQPCFPIQQQCNQRCSFTCE